MIGRAVSDPKRKRKAKRFIRRATKKGKGRLTSFAKKHRLMNKDGTIDLKSARRFVKRNLKGKNKTRRLREINLAKTLRELD